MTDNITLPRAVVEQVREALKELDYASEPYVNEIARTALAALDAALAEPEQKQKQKPVVVEQLFALAKLTVRRAADPDPWVWDRLADDGTWTPFNPLIHGPDMWRLEQAIRAALAEPEHIHTCPPNCQKPLCVNRLREIEAAVEAEREACARTVDHVVMRGGGTYGGAIRARGSK
jgi:hypothetical protein